MKPSAPQPGHVYVIVYLTVARMLLCASAVYLTMARVLVPAIQVNGSADGFAKQNKNQIARRHLKHPVTRRLLATLHPRVAKEKIQCNTAS